MIVIKRRLKLAHRIVAIIVQPSDARGCATGSAGQRGGVLLSFVRRDATAVPDQCLTDMENRHRIGYWLGSVGRSDDLTGQGRTHPEIQKWANHLERVLWDQGHFNTPTAALPAAVVKPICPLGHTILSGAYKRLPVKAHSL